MILSFHDVEGSSQVHRDDSIPFSRAEWDVFVKLLSEVLAGKQISFACLTFATARSDFDDEFGSGSQLAALLDS